MLVISVLMCVDGVRLVVFMCGFLCFYWDWDVLVFVWVMWRIVFICVVYCGMFVFGLCGSWFVLFVIVCCVVLVWVFMLWCFWGYRWFMYRIVCVVVWLLGLCSWLSFSLCERWMYGLWWVWSCFVLVMLWLGVVVWVCVRFFLVDVVVFGWWWWSVFW